MNLARIVPLVLLATAVANAQTFEVASIRPTPPTPMSLRIEPGGRFIATGAPILQLIMKAYGVRTFQVVAGNNPLMYARYDISAKPEGNASDEKVLVMLRTLLADRFKLQFHREKRDTQVYVLTAGKNGPKMAVAQPSETGGVRMRGMGRLTGMAASPLQLAEALSDLRLNGRAFLDRPVLDETGLRGPYNFTLDWTPDGISGPTPGATGPSIFTAVQEQLGLKLETRHAAIDFLMMDRLEKPTEN